MGNLLFLGLAVVFTAIGCTIIWLRQRKPSSVDTSVDAFRRELNALAPDRAREHDADRFRDGDAG
ncbi:MAG TPA: hypothetical protein VHC63_16810 [Acidimicrobiales bacterium]|nr:hypothetical protein [Acidimicrobiales bacterium]